MEQIKESEKIINDNSSPQVEKLNKELEAKTLILKNLTDEHNKLKQMCQKIRQSGEDSTVISALKQKITDLETKIPNMIQEFTQYVEQQNSLHSIKEKELCCSFGLHDCKLLQNVFTICSHFLNFQTTRNSGKDTWPFLSTSTSSKHFLASIILKDILKMLLQR